jgi:hypothetical protein
MIDGGAQSGGRPSESLQGRKPRMMGRTGAVGSMGI